MKKIICAVFAVCMFWTAGSASCRAEEELAGEIVDLVGTASVIHEGGSQGTLREGDMIKPGETIKTGKGAAATLALDGDLKNVVYLAEGTELKVRSLYPTDLEMTKGDVLSKLGALPKGSTFNLETPVGAAAVRGSQFRTVYGDKGMEVFNLEHSNVYVFNQGADGKLSETPVIVPQSQKTELTGRGMKPSAPQQIPTAQMNAARLRQDQMARGVERRVAQGIPPKIPRIDQVQRMYKEKVEQARQSGGQGGEDSGNGKPKFGQNEHGAVDMQDRMMRQMDGADVQAKKGPGGDLKDKGPQGDRRPEGQIGKGPMNNDRGGEQGGPNGPRKGEPQGQNQGPQQDRHQGPQMGEPYPAGPGQQQGPQDDSQGPQGPQGPGKQGGGKPQQPGAGRPGPGPRPRQQ